MSDSESYEVHPPRNRLSYAIPMPYLPSSSSSETEKPGTSSSSTEAIPSTLESPMPEPRSPTKVQSKAVVRYSEVGLPVPLSRIAQNTDLRNPPKNWLHKGRETKGFGPSTHVQSGFSSFKMANDFVDVMPDVDVISDAENIKKLLKIPYSNTSLSMIVHRVGKTLLIDDFDIHQYLLRRSATEWEWLRKYFAQTILHEIKDKEGAVVRKNCSNSALQEKNLVSKFLYRSLLHSVDDSDEIFGDEVKESSEDSALNNIPPLPDPEIEKSLPQLNQAKEEGFARNFLWNFEDIRMLIGSNMPIFGDEEHPCVSLKLRDMKKPINVLTGLDYWLDNLMCQVPEIVMCYHIDGIVQKYELIKTEDLPSMEGSKFSPKIVKNIAQNILSFLKSNAAKEGHTYWLFKGKNDDIVKLYDLTSLSQKDSGIQPKDSRDGDQQPGAAADGDFENPFQTPVSLLLYRLARNILEAQPSQEDSAVARALLKNCIELIDKTKFPHIATSAHFLLSELYVPADTDPAKPSFPKVEPVKPAAEEDSTPDDSAESEDESSVDIHTLCHPGKFRGFRDKNPVPPISGDVEFRCTEALQHIDLGLKYITALEARNKARADAYRKEQEKIERENIKMSVPGQAIPMGYIASDNRIVKRTRSFSCGEKGGRLEPLYTTLSSAEYLKFLLLKKALLVYITLAEINFDVERFGRSLKCVKRALNCFSMVESMGGPVEAKIAGGMVSFALGVAGDCYLAFISRWGNLPMYQEQYNAMEAGEGGIAEEIEKYTEEGDRDWTIKQPKDIEEGLRLSALCYTKALDGKNMSSEDELSLQRRLGNVKNEQGVFIMNQATTLIQNISVDASSEVVSSSLSAAEELLSKSKVILEEGITLFQAIKDSANIALLLSNSGRLWRIAGHIKSQTREMNKNEFGDAEMLEYKKALNEYLTALQTLGTRKVNPSVWDSVSWELCCTYFTVGTLLQDQAPLSSLSREEAEKQVTEYLTKSLKYCDLEMSGPRQVVYQYRAAVIHQRLASLYHHSYRSFEPGDNSFRRKKLKQLSESHYSKAAPLFYQLDRFGDYLRSQLEKCGLFEAQMDSQSTGGSKQKLYRLVLDTLLESIPALERMIPTADKNIKEISNESTEKSAEEKEEEVFLTRTLLHRVQSTLLSLYKIVSAKPVKKGKEADGAGKKIKSLYGESLKTNENVEDILKLLRSIKATEL